jgi:carbon-monoxide dehydrogenase medium subunit
MTLPAFGYERPASLEEALAGAGAEGRRWLAGGMSLLPLMKMQLAAPERLVDLSGVEELVGVREEGNSLRIGAMTRHHQVATNPTVRQHAPLLAAVARVIGDPQVRRRGTIGGSLAHADPAADFPAAVLALEADIECASPGDRRRIPADDFFMGPLTTALKPDELVIAIHVPTSTAGWRHAYRKHPHPASGYAVVGVAALLAVQNGRIEHARLAVTGVAGRAFRARQAESILTGRPGDDATIREAAMSVTEGQEVLGDTYASSEYRGHLATVLAERAIRQCVAPA